MTPTHYGAVYLAFLDVLGFKALVENNTHQKVVDLYSNVLDGFASKIPQIISKVEQKSYKVNSLMIQDSIILWIEAHHYLYLNVLIGAIQKLLLNGFLNGLAIRGAISYGEISVLSKEGEKYAIYSIIGKPIVDAYNAEENQDWIGCICADSLISTLEQFKLDLIVRDKYLIEYKIPRKDGLTKKGYAVRWHIDMIRQNTDAIVRECFAMHSRDIKKPDIENKIINTIKFIEEVDPIGQFLERIEY